MDFIFTNVSGGYNRNLLLRGRSILKMLKWVCLQEIPGQEKFTTRGWPGCMAPPVTTLSTICVCVYIYIHIYVHIYIHIYTHI